MLCVVPECRGGVLQGTQCQDSVGAPVWVPLCGAPVCAECRGGVLTGDPQCQDIVVPLCGCSVWQSVGRGYYGGPQWSRDSVVPLCGVLCVQSGRGGGTTGTTVSGQCDCPCVVAPVCRV